MGMVDELERFAKTSPLPCGQRNLVLTTVMREFFFPLSDLAADLHDLAHSGHGRVVG